ncbi:unnamed protein product [Mucor circinelloides]|uniref:Tetraspanin Tsp2 n=1 Tax=Mucor circinelloides f. circinelloides (strain 1006PhL) TaxID=1220926 RepID=S2K7J0_MUCC1|nr:hypothetical protein HMPREF1544_04938 [Mucor circinelloides 1006PhL]
MDDSGIIAKPKSYLGLTLSRWAILLSSCTLFSYGFIFLIGSLSSYANGYSKATIVTIVNKNLLSAIFCASFLCVVTAVIGIFAVQRKDRHFLACHTVLLWPCLALLTTVAYLAYRETTWDLKTQLGMQWRYDFTPDEHYALQENLHCCGFENSSDHARYKSGCSQESLLQGCHEKLYTFESYFLVKVYSICFGLIPVHMLVIVMALIYARPSMPGRYYGKPAVIRSPSLKNEYIPHSHDASTKPIHHCLACENWTF